MVHRLCIVFVLIFAAVTGAAGVPNPKIKLGIDVLRDSNFEILKGKRVGLVCNPPSVDSRLNATVDVLRRAEGVQLVALYGPEHGVYGDAYAGEKVRTKTDPRTGLPAYSVYGKTRRPTTQMLKPIDTLVFDLQDIGSRSYTYISSMKECMRACAEHDIEFVVLDRPNPLGGNRIEGPGLEKAFESFIGYVYVPYVHGMTMGELARFVQKTELPDYKKLRVVKMEGWTRDMVWDDTGLAWIPTSPHLPHADGCASYAATGFIGELLLLSNGVGYTLPFEVVGAPDINGELLAEALNQHWDAPDLYYLPKITGKAPMRLPVSRPDGVAFRPLRYRPFYATFKDKPCQGVQVLLDPKTKANLVEINFKLMEALGAPEQFANAKKDRLRSWDITCGSDEPRRYLTEMRDLRPLFAKWRQECDAFRAARKPYLLYE
jgi:uncharacterized protein YbbC (DUF1343 family)